MAKTVENYAEIELEDSMIPEGYNANDLLEDVKMKEDEGDADADTEETEEAPTTGNEEETEEAEAEQQNGEKPEDKDALKPDEPKKLKFKAKIDHRDVDAEIDESDLPNIYQKAQNHDRMQKRLADAESGNKEWENIAKMLGYNNATEMRKAVPENYRKSEVQKLIDRGVDEDVAEETVASKLSRKNAEDENAESDHGEAEEKEETNGNVRDFKKELDELYSFHPELSGQKLPDEVVSNVTRNNKRVVVAYQEYLDAKKEKELADAKKENKILKQNAAAAAKSPVKGVGSGASETSKLSKIEQRMLKAFDDD